MTIAQHLEFEFELGARLRDLQADLERVTRERDRYKRLLELLEHPSGRDCPWCFAKQSEPHDLHCEIKAALTEPERG